MYISFLNRSGMLTGFVSRTKGGIMKISEKDTFLPPDSELKAPS